ncbi:MFS transporter [Cryobacterium sp. GrIS_2_6]|uniref:MFS transporter n=1 Tax=Cryobacterium sp. GrIS_2_6 TaxID=3162785 RepID=UPI002E049E6E|nr:MFS transporter [Cryobacterium psychrotolerans]MEC5148657.1 MFS family permease [Cryobacterium psychrotolerans]
MSQPFTRRVPIWLAIVASSLPVFMATLDDLVVTGALPVVNRDLGACIEELQWVINAYSLSFATFMLMAVAIGDRFGRRTVFLAGIAIFTVASALAGLSTEPWQLITARAIQGVGAAALMTIPWTLAPMVVAPLTGLLSPRTGTRLPIVLGFSFLAIAMGWLAVEMSATVAYIDLVPAFLLAGVGMGLVFVPSSTAVLANMVPNDHAKATGTNSTLREIGVALGVAVLTAASTGAGGELTAAGYVGAVVPAIVVGASVLALAALIGLTLPHGRRAPAATPAPEPVALSV